MLFYKKNRGEGAIERNRVSNGHFVINKYVLRVHCKQCTIVTRVYKISSQLFYLNYV